MIRTVIDVGKFRAWLAVQDPHARYDYISADHCPIALFLKSVGATMVSVGPMHASFDSGGVAYLATLPYAVRGALNNGDYVNYTFGKALARLDANSKEST